MVRTASRRPVTTLLLLLCLICAVTDAARAEEPGSSSAKSTKKLGPELTRIEPGIRPEPESFRDLYWGMSPAEVAAIEGAKPGSAPSPYNPREWTGSALAESCRIFFRYEDDRLVQFELRFDTYYADFRNREEVSLASMFLNFERMAAELTRVYGNPSLFDDVPLNGKRWKPLKGQNRRSGIATGKLAPTAIWEFPDSLVELSNGNYWVFDKNGSDNLYLKITYSSREWLEREAEKARPIAPLAGGI